MRLDDRVTGAGLAILAFVVIVLARDIPSVPGTTFGPDLMPTLVGVALAGLSISIFWSGWRDRAERPLLDLSVWRDQPRGLISLAWTLGGILIGLLFFHQIGFPLFGFVFSLGLMLIMGARPLPAVLTSFIMVLGLHAVFARVFFVPLPAGSFPLPW